MERHRCGGPTRAVKDRWRTRTVGGVGSSTRPIPSRRSVNVFSHSEPVRFTVSELPIDRGTRPTAHPERDHALNAGANTKTREIAFADRTVRSKHCRPFGHGP
jgi:hypothetical protein